MGDAPPSPPPTGIPPTPKALVDPPGRPYFAPAEPRGAVEVKLVPTEVVRPGVPVLVTFGFPFPRGSISDLATVRVLDRMTEIPSHVSLLAPWRGTSSVRWARIQLLQPFSGPRTVTVSWGGAPRLLDVATSRPAREAWHLVTRGTFVAADGVREPDVFAVLPAAWLSKGGLTGRQALPFDRSIREERDDPAVIDRTPHQPGFREQDLAAKNFFYTLINEDDPRVLPDQLCPYKTDAEPWLYDRAAAIFTLYARSGFLRALREGVRAAEFYRIQLHPDGVFKLKAPREGDRSGGANTNMYSTAEGLAYLHWLTGDDTPLAAIRAVASVHGPAVRWSADADSFTERQHAFRLLTTLVAYEVTGDEPLLAIAREQLEAFFWHQDGAGGGLPARRVDGALWHHMQQHENFGGDLWIASVWMSALISDAAVRAYGVTLDPRIGPFVVRLARFAVHATRRMKPPSVEEAELRLVDYLTRIDGEWASGEGPTEDHALEVASMIAWGSWFSEAIGQPDPQLRAIARELYTTYDAFVSTWVRPDAPGEAGKTAFRIPTGTFRRYGWEHRPSGSLSWLLRP